MFSGLRTVYKVLVLVIAVGVVPLVTIGTISLIQSSGDLSVQVFRQLEGLRETKKTQLITFFKERERDLNVLCDIVAAFKEEAGPSWTPHKLENFFSKYLHEYDYYDLLIIHPEGEILFSLARESDYGSNMLTGRYSDSNLGRLVRKVVRTGKIGMVDFAPYPPSKNQPAAFVAEPILKGDRIELIIALQLSIEAINKIMMKRTGLGKTGETYLVGRDMLMRSDSFLDPVNRSILASFAHPDKGRVDTEASRQAMAGITGEKIIIDYNGNPVLSAYTPISLWDVNWALIAEMDVAEAFAPINRLAWLISIVAIIGITAVVVAGLLIALLFFNRPGKIAWGSRV